MSAPPMTSFVHRDLLLSYPVATRTSSAGAAGAVHRPEQVGKGIACTSAASGILARSADNARSMALSTKCHSVADLGFREGSASSHEVSRSLMRFLAPTKSPLSTRDAVSATIVRNGERLPSFAAAASAAGTSRGAPAGKLQVYAASADAANDAATGRVQRIFTSGSFFTVSKAFCAGPVRRLPGYAFSDAG